MVMAEKMLIPRRSYAIFSGYLEKSSQEYPINEGVPQSSILSPTIFLLFVATGFGLELESDLRDTIDWGRKWLVNCGVIDVKIEVI